MSYIRAPRSADNPRFSGLIKTYNVLHCQNVANLEHAYPIRISTSCTSMINLAAQSHVVDLHSCVAEFHPRATSTTLTFQCLAAFAPHSTTQTTRASLLSMPNHVAFTVHADSGLASHRLVYDEASSGAVPAIKPEPMVAAPLTLYVLLEAAPSDGDKDTLKAARDRPLIDVVLSGSLTLHTNRPNSLET